LTAVGVEDLVGFGQRLNFVDILLVGQTLGIKLSSLMPAITLIIKAGPRVPRWIPNLANGCSGKKESKINRWLSLPTHIRYSCINQFEVVNKFLSFQSSATEATQFCSHFNLAYMQFRQLHLLLVEPKYCKLS
jgi:hypothetical protein